MLDFRRADFGRRAATRIRSDGDSRAPPTAQPFRRDGRLPDTRNSERSDAVAKVQASLNVSREVLSVAAQKCPSASATHDNRVDSVVPVSSRRALECVAHVAAYALCFSGDWHDLGQMGANAVESIFRSCDHSLS